MGYVQCVRTLGNNPVTCNSRRLLFEAHASLERGDLIAAGCKLREAIRRFLAAECEYHDCLPNKREQRSPMALAKALRKGGELGPNIFQWITECIEIGNKAAHLVFVRPSLIACCLDLMHSFLDDSPYLIEPAAAGPYLIEPAAAGRLS